MLKEDLKTAIRNLRRNKFHSAINIFGLSAGFTAVLLISLFLFNEFTFDNFHKKNDLLYRVSVKWYNGGVLNGEGPNFTPPLGPAMLQNFPEVKNYARISTERVGYASYNKDPIKIENMHHADPSFFDLFSFPMTEGDPKTALIQPYSIVLTHSSAKKLFGNEFGLGKTIRMDNKENYTVTGIAKDPPPNSTIQFNALISFSTLYKDPNLFLDWNGGNQYIHFVELKKTATTEQVNAKLPGLLWKNINQIYAKAGARVDAYLQPLPKLHMQYELESESLRSNMKIFSMIAIFILFIACINFINLTTARSTKRAKEVGVRKVLGAGRKDLVRQFLIEAVITTFISFVISLGLFAFSSRLYEQVFGKEFLLPSSMNFSLIAIIVFLFFLVAIGVGIYPAFYLSRFKPIPVLKGLITKEGKPFLRNALVIVQFSISIALIASTFIIFQQQQYIRNKKLGFNKDNIVVLPLVGDEASLKTDFLKQKLLQIPGILSVSASSEVPHRGLTTNGYKPEGRQDVMQIHVLDVDEDFLGTYNIPLATGKNFSKQRPYDQNGFIINETLARLLGWSNPIGKKILRNGEHEVIGVVKDFHFASLHEKIEPMLMTNKPWQDKFDFLALHYTYSKPSVILDQIKASWKKLFPSTPFDYWFLNESYNRLYSSEQQFQRGFMCASLLAIFLAILGVLGLITFSIEQRTKEIGIRKVLGATSFSLASLISKDFLKLILFANLVAWPFAWYFMNKWLQDFANRIHLDWWVFLVAGLLALIIALCTVGLQALKAAWANPVKNLRSE